MRAVYAGPGADRVLRAGGRGKITVAGRTGAYAQLGGGHLHICAVGAPFGPLSVAVTRPEGLELRPGVEVVATAGELRIGGASVSLDRVRVRGRATPPGVRAADTGRPAARAVVDGSGALRTVEERPDGRAADEVRARLPPLPLSLAAGRRALEAGDLPAAVAALAGRGAGLTPDGDDVLAGYAAWRHAAGAPVALADAAAGLASPIGLSYLRCAERGELPDAAARVLAALVAGERAVALTALLAWGSSSGAALAHGMIAGAR